jgi:hypothetical protein
MALTLTGSFKKLVQKRVASDPRMTRLGDGEAVTKPDVSGSGGWGYFRFVHVCDIG